MKGNIKISNKDKDIIHLLDLILIIFDLKSPSKTTESNKETTKILDMETEKGRDIPSKTKNRFRILEKIVLLIYS